MKKTLQKIAAAVLTASLFAGLCAVPSSAAAATNCYTIGKKDTTVYKNKELTKKSAVIHSSDELSVKSVTKKKAKITWTAQNGKSKTGYIQTSAILKNTTGKTYTAKAEIDAYRRPGGPSYGKVSSKDKVTVLGTSGTYTQIKYPAGGGWRYAFITTAKAKKYVTSGGDSAKPATGSVSYAPYKGIRYNNQGISKARKAALDKARKMVTIRWKAPCDFPTWADGNGTFSEAVAEDGTRSRKFLEGKTYTGVPYSMTDHSYDNTAWADLLKNGITKKSMTAKFAQNPKAGTAKGIDCSYFVYQALGSAVGFDKIEYQVTTTMQQSKLYKKIKWNNIKPGDVLVNSNHTMLYVGTSGNYYGIFEASSYESKCSYKLYPKEYVTSNYDCYKFKGFSD